MSFETLPLIPEDDPVHVGTWAEEEEHQPQHQKTFCAYIGNLPRNGLALDTVQTTLQRAVMLMVDARLLVKIQVYESLSPSDDRRWAVVEVKNKECRDNILECNGFFIMDRYIIASDKANDTITGRGGLMCITCGLEKLSGVSRWCKKCTDAMHLISKFRNCGNLNYPPTVFTQELYRAGIHARNIHRRCMVEKCIRGAQCTRSGCAYAHSNFELQLGKALRDYRSEYNVNYHDQMKDVEPLFLARNPTAAPGDYGRQIAPRVPPHLSHRQRFGPCPLRPQDQRVHQALVGQGAIAPQYTFFNGLPCYTVLAPARLGDSADLLAQTTLQLGQLSKTDLQTVAVERLRAANAQMLQAYVVIAGTLNKRSPNNQVENPYFTAGNNNPAPKENNIFFVAPKDKEEEDKEDINNAKEMLKAMAAQVPNTQWTPARV